MFSPYTQSFSLCTGPRSLFTELLLLLLRVTHTRQTQRADSRRERILKPKMAAPPPGQGRMFSYICCVCSTPIASVFELRGRFRDIVILSPSSSLNSSHSLDYFYDSIISAVCKWIDWLPAIDRSSWMKPPAGCRQTLRCRDLQWCVPVNA